MSENQSSHDVRLSVTNIGGINEAEVHFSPGVTILKGRNATNRTSLLQALMAALGSDSVSLKGDAEEAHVNLSVNGEEYARTFHRTDGSIKSQGEPYLEDAEVADLFAFLLESNEARRAVEGGDDLRELIMEPVDTEAIQRQIRQLSEEKKELDQKIGQLDELKNNLPQLEQERTKLESELETKHNELEQKKEELDEADADLDEKRQDRSELNSKFDELKETRSTLEDIRFQIETEEESLEALRKEQKEVESELEEIPEEPAGDLEEVEAQISRLREQKMALETELNELQSVIQFNEEMLNDTSEETNSWLDEPHSTSSVTDQLLSEQQTVTCWTCGSEIAHDQISSTLDQLRTQRKEKLGTSQSLQEQLDDLLEKRARIENQRKQGEALEEQLNHIETEIENRKSSLENLRNRREKLTDEIRTLETDIEALEEQDYQEVLELHKEVNQLEFEISQLENDLQDVKEEISSVEERLAKEEQLKQQRSELNEELGDLRTRIDQIEEEAVEQFNTHMDAVLDILDYTNLERIWIDRTKEEVRKGRQKVTSNVFSLHIVRQSDSGVAYEDTVDHLSESEREVTGLIFALAGYLVHEVYETLPFILLDSLEAIDADRIAKLIEYLEEYADYLVVALLSEDAAALDSTYQRITEI